MTVSRAPIARPDWESATLAGLFAGGLGGIGAGWLSAGYLHTPSLLQIAIHAASVGLYGAPSQVVSVLAASGAIAATFGISAFLLVSGEKIEPTVHASGGQIKGIGAAKQAVKKDPSDLLFHAAGIPFTRDRIRRSMFVLGSIGGGKTQLIWHEINGMLKTNHKLIVIDGPKGDFSTCWPADYTLIAPWHDGASWDIASDCPTRNHALNLAAQLIPSNDSDPMWSNAAQAVLITVICSLQVEFGTKWGWGELYERLSYTPEQLKELAAQYYPPALQSLADAESKTTGSILINLSAFMSPVFEIALAWKDSKSRFSFSSWWSDDSSKIRTVILQGSAEFQRVSSAYIASIISLLSSLTASPSFPESKTRQNVIIVDELAQFQKLNGIEKFIEIGRSKGCSLILGTQTLAQVRKIYGADDMQAWSSMIGTKVFCRVAGADDVELTIREIGEKEVFRRTETITSNGTQGGSASVGWAKEKLPVVTQGQLEELGPDKDAGGCHILLKGFGQDVIKTICPFITVPPVRKYCIPNPHWNQHINNAPQPAPVVAENSNSDTEFAEIAATDAPQPAEAVHIEHDTTDYTDSELIIQTAESPAPVDVYTDNSDGEHTENMFDEIGHDAIESGFSDVAGEALGVDSHVIELGLELTELLDGDACKRVDSADVAAVVGGESKTGKRGLFKKGNRRKHVDSIDSQEVQQ